MNKKSVRDIDVSNKRVLVRVDFNVPLDFLIDDEISIDKYNSKLISLEGFDDETIADIKSYIAYKRYLLSLEK